MWRRKERKKERLDFWFFWLWWNEKVYRWWFLHPYTITFFFFFFSHFVVCNNFHVPMWNIMTQTGVVMDTRRNFYYKHIIKTILIPDLANRIHHPDHKWDNQEDGWQARTPSHPLVPSSPSMCWCTPSFLLVML